jgi:prevent-host-death family protein
MGDSMEITTKQLRIQPGRIISQVSAGQEITVTYRGKPSAKIIPIGAANSDTPEELFGIWKDRDDIGNVGQYVRAIRKKRKL